MQTEIKINIIELASELAERRVEEEFKKDPLRFDNRIYIEEENEVRYTEAAQDVFNTWYDYYYTEIEFQQIQ